MISLLKKLESKKLRKKFKKDFHKRVTKGDYVSVIYYDLELEQVKLQQFTGVCIKFKSAGLNTKLYVRNVLSNILVEQQFFIYSDAVLDLKILRKK